MEIDAANQRYNHVRSGALLADDGTGINQMYLYIKKPLDAFIEALISTIGDPSGEESSLAWRGLHVEGWSDSTVRFSIELSQIVGLNDKWNAVYMQVSTDEGKDLLVPTSQSRQRIEA